MKRVNNIILKRCLYQNIHEETLECWVHGFGDASKKSFCANVYLVYQKTSGAYSSFIAVKPRVVPVKNRTIPRLELMSARILTTLTNTVKSALGNQKYDAMVRRQDCVILVTEPWRMGAIREASNR